MRELLDRLVERRDLTEGEADALLRGLAEGSAPPALAGALLVALRMKGVTAEEVRGFARAMRALARRPEIPPGAPTLDIVGTGGDRSGSVNLSTGSALLAAACGTRVVKHGNRSVSSRAGSADTLEALGLVLPLDEQAAGRCLAATGFTFLFAAHYHPAMKAIAPVRAVLGLRTVFNILGPLTNPAEPDFHLIGAFDLPTARLMAQTLAGLRIVRAFVVHGAEGWDEPTPLGPFTLFDVTPGRVAESVRDPADIGLARCDTVSLRGEDAAYNAGALRRALCGETRGGLRDALVLGTGLALELTGGAADWQAGAARAAAAIDSGDARRVLQALPGPWGAS
jgi:anthranilate phosphoribosyltransferase